MRRSTGPRPGGATAPRRRRASWRRLPEAPGQPAGRARASILERLVDQVAKERPVEVPAPRRLRHEDREKRLPRIDPERGAGDAAPGVLAGRPGRVADTVGQ